MMIILIDNYDSFTWNLYHYLGELGAETVVHRNDAVSVGQVLSARPAAIVLSPGPCTPNEAGICLDLITQAQGSVPILGVCLGHQAIGQACGGRVVRAETLMHGKVSRIRHHGGRMFRAIPDEFEATRYHSLIVERQTLPDCLEVTAETDDGVIMAFSHKTMPLHGVQFHPESIASEHGHTLLQNFLALARSDTSAFA